MKNLVLVSKYLIVLSSLSVSYLVHSAAQAERKKDAAAFALMAALPLTDSEHKKVAAEHERKSSEDEQLRLRQKIEAVPGKLKAIVSKYPKKVDPKTFSQPVIAKKIGETIPADLQELADYYELQALNPDHPDLDLKKIDEARMAIEQYAAKLVQHYNANKAVQKSGKTINVPKPLVPMSLDQLKAAEIKKQAQELTQDFMKTKSAKTADFEEMVVHYKDTEKMAENTRSQLRELRIKAANDKSLYEHIVQQQQKIDDEMVDLTAEYQKRRMEEHLKYYQDILADKIQKPSDWKEQYNANIDMLFQAEAFAQHYNRKRLVTAIGDTLQKLKIIRDKLLKKEQEYVDTGTERIEAFNAMKKHKTKESCQRFLEALQHSLDYAKKYNDKEAAELYLQDIGVIKKDIRELEEAESKAKVQLPAIVPPAKKETEPLKQPEPERKKSAAQQLPSVAAAVEDAAKIPAKKRLQGKRPRKLDTSVQSLQSPSSSASSQGSKSPRLDPLVSPKSDNLPPVRGAKSKSPHAGTRNLLSPTQQPHSRRPSTSSTKQP